MDRLEAMRVFAAVAEHGGFSQAARRMGVSPAQVSKAVAKLERYLGARLLERTTRSVNLTPAGAAYLDRAKTVLAEFDALEDGVRSAHADPAGVVRVSAPIVFGVRRLMPLVLKFLDQHPQVEVRLALNDRVVDLVDEGFDLAVRIGNLADSSLMARRLSPSVMVLVCKPDHAAVREVSEPQDLTHYACVVDTNMHQPQRWVFSRGEQTEDVRITGRLWVNSADASRQAALAGYGVALTPLFVIEEDLDAGRLVRLLPDWDPQPRDIWAVFPQNRMLAARVRLFIDHLASSFGAQSVPLSEPLLTE